MDAAVERLEEAWVRGGVQNALHRVHVGAGFEAGDDERADGFQLLLERGQGSVDYRRHCDWEGMFEVYGKSIMCRFPR